MGLGCRPASIGQVHAAEAITTLEAIGIVGIVLDAAVGIRNGQVIDSNVIWTLNIGVVPKKHSCMFSCILIINDKYKYLTQ